MNLLTRNQSSLFTETCRKFQTHNVHYCDRTFASPSIRRNDLHPDSVPRHIWGNKKSPFSHRLMFNPEITEINVCRYIVLHSELLQFLSELFSNLIFILNKSCDSSNAFCMSPWTWKHFGHLIIKTHKLHRCSYRSW